MGEATQHWAPAVYPTGIRTVVLEENGNQQWGIDIHGLRRGLNHAQVVAALQRVPSPDGVHSQAVMSTQANCLQADGQNYYCPPPDGHANSWCDDSIPCSWVKRSQTSQS